MSLQLFSPLGYALLCISLFLFILFALTKSILLICLAYVFASISIFAFISAYLCENKFIYNLNNFMLRLLNNKFIEKNDTFIIDYLLKIMPNKGKNSVESLIEYYNNNDYDTYYDFIKLLNELPVETDKVQFSNYLNYMRNNLLNEMPIMSVQDYFEYYDKRD